MNRSILTGCQWRFLAPLLPGKTSDCGVTAKDNRSFLEAVLWIARTGSPWRDLPESFGNWHNIYVRYDRWAKKGVWKKLFALVASRPDLRHLMIDGTIVRVHQHGAAKKTNKQSKRKDAPVVA